MEKKSTGNIVQLVDGRKDSGESITFLSAVIRAYPNDGFSLDQESYTRDLLAAWNMLECRQCVTPGEPVGLELEDEKGENASIEDVRLTHTLAGSLIWLSTRTRPYIAYAQHRISSLAVRAPRKALAEGKRTLRYLNGTTDYALIYRQTEVT